MVDLSGVAGCGGALFMICSRALSVFGLSGVVGRGRQGAVPLCSAIDLSVLGGVVVELSGFVGYGWREGVPLRFSADLLFLRGSGGWVVRCFWRCVFTIFYNHLRHVVWHTF